MRTALTGTSRSNRTSNPIVKHLRRARRNRCTQFVNIYLNRQSTSYSPLPLLLPHSSEESTWRGSDRADPIVEAGSHAFLSRVCCQSNPQSRSIVLRNICIPFNCWKEANWNVKSCKTRVAAQDMEWYPHEASVVTLYGPIAVAITGTIVLAILLTRAAPYGRYQDIAWGIIIPARVRACNLVGSVSISHIPLNMRYLMLSPICLSDSSGPGSYKRLLPLLLASGSHLAVRRIIHWPTLSSCPCLYALLPFLVRAILIRMSQGRTTLTPRCPHLSLRSLTTFIDRGSTLSF